MTARVGSISHLSHTHQGLHSNSSHVLDNARLVVAVARMLLLLHSHVAAGAAASALSHGAAFVVASTAGTVDSCASPKTVRRGQALYKMAAKRCMEVVTM
jgi:hypothetical protein